MTQLTSHRPLPRPGRRSAPLDFTHWLIVDGRVIGEAAEVDRQNPGECQARVRHFDAPASGGPIRVPSHQLLAKHL